MLGFGPVAAMACAWKLPTYSRRRSTESRSGSTETNTVCSRSRSLPSKRSTFAIVASVVGQTSGQNV